MTAAEVRAAGSALAGVRAEIKRLQQQRRDGVGDRAAIRSCLQVLRAREDVLWRVTEGLAPVAPVDGGA